MNPRLYIVGLFGIGAMVLMGMGVLDPDKGLAFLGGALLGLPGPKGKR